MRVTSQEASAGSDAERLLKYEMSLIADLKPADRNAREHSPSQFDALTDSVAEFGVISPVIIDGKNRIVAGHGRVEAAKKAGRTTIATLQVEHLTEAQLRLYAIADNRIAERSTWDENALAIELQQIRLEAPELNLAISGFEHPKIELKIAQLEQSRWSDLDEVPEAAEAAEPVTQLGDIWDFSDGDHRLVCGDSTSAHTIGSLLSGETTDLLATDLPYNLTAKAYSGKGKHQHGDFAMAAGEMSREQFTDTWRPRSSPSSPTFGPVPCSTLHGLEAHRRFAGRGESSRLRAEEPGCVGQR